MSGCGCCGGVVPFSADAVRERGMTIEAHNEQLFWQLSERAETLERSLQLQKKSSGRKVRSHVESAWGADCVLTPVMVVRNCM